jgi:hypothetical protein
MNSGSKPKLTAGLGRTRSFSFKSQPISIWPASSMPPLTPVPSADGMCSARGVVYSGRDQTGTLQIRAWHPNKAIQSAVITLAVGENTVSSTNPFVSRSQNNLVVVQRLPFDAFEGFHSYTYTVLTTIPGLNSNECLQVRLEPYFWEGAKR